MEIVANTPLLKRPVVDGAEPLRARDMVVDVCMDEDAPPMYTDADTAVKPAEKAFQLGQDACAKVLRSITSDLAVSTRYGIIIVDIGNRTNDLGRAFINEYMRMSFPVTFLSFINEERVEWVMQNTIDHTKEKFLNGDLPIPGHTPLASTAETVENLPHPALTTCSWSGSGPTSKMVIPEKIKNDWQENPRFGQSFKDWVDAAKKDGFVAFDKGETEDSVDPPGTPIPKRRRTTLGQSPDPAVSPAKPSPAPACDLPVPRVQIQTYGSNSKWRLETKTVLMRCVAKST